MSKEFKLIVAGGRDFTNRELLNVAIKQTIGELPDGLKVSIVSGMAAGADSLGYEWAMHNNCQVYRHYAEWKKYGRRAGYLRNEEMANQSQGLLAFWDGESKGTQHMIQIARNKNLYVKVVPYGKALLKSKGDTQ